MKMMFKIAIAGGVLMASVACKPRAFNATDDYDDSEMASRIPKTDDNSWKDDKIVAPLLASPQAVRINAKSNMLFYYENGVPIAKWKVATARPGASTPKGVFRVHQKEECPPWDSGHGKSAAACAANNPLGKRALWFQEGRIYGMHGVDEGHLASVTASSPWERNQSSGCVRNHPSNIEWLFNRAKVGMPVVIGLWPTDPEAPDCSGNGAACGKIGTSPTATPATETLLPKTLPTWCAMNVSAGVGLARVRTEAKTSAAIVKELAREAKVKVENKVAGEAVNGSTDWYFVTFTLGGPQQGYLHGSLLDCTR